MARADGLIIVRLESFLSVPTQPLLPSKRDQEWMVSVRDRQRRADEPLSGQRFTIPSITLHDPSAHDSDGDGLHDLAEFIMNTDPGDPDTDDDGILDGAEVQLSTIIGKRSFLVTTQVAPP